jgi:hypothetical protein
MNVEKLKELIEPSKLLDDTSTESNDATSSQSTIDTSLIGKYCIIRTYSAGNFCGYLDKKIKEEIILKDARRLWYWKNIKGLSLSSIALYGIDQEHSRVTAPVEHIWLQAIEIIPVTKIAMDSLISIKETQQD